MNENSVDKIRPTDILAKDKGPVPDWLKGPHPKPGFSKRVLQEFLSERTVYYPGSGVDGDPLKTFGGSHSACCFVYADYHPGIIDDIMGRLWGALTDEGYRSGVKGYSIALSHSLKHEDLKGVIDFGVHPPKNFYPPNRSPFDFWNKVDLEREDDRLGIWCILERDGSLNDDHGPEFLAFLMLSVDAVWLYWYLWARNKKSPFGILIQDHGFGCQWTSFGGNSKLFQMAVHQGSKPKWLLVPTEDSTLTWPGYIPCSGLGPRSGMGGSRRALFKLGPELNSSSTSPNKIDRTKTRFSEMSVHNQVT